jgi:hypothetical protein
MAFGVSTYQSPSRASGSTGGGGKQTLQKVVLSATLGLNSIALFDELIPSDYELYVNGQWHDKGMLKEVQIDDFTLAIPGVNWEASETVDLKYYRLV